MSCLFSTCESLEEQGLSTFCKGAHNTIHLQQPETNLISHLSVLISAAVSHRSSSPLKACLPSALQRLLFLSLSPRLATSCRQSIYTGPWRVGEWLINMMWRCCLTLCRSFTVNWYWEYNSLYGIRRVHVRSRNNLQNVLHKCTVDEQCPAPCFINSSLTRFTWHHNWSGGQLKILW